MTIWFQTFLAFATLTLIVGYFQYRRSRDIITVTQELLQPARLIPIIIGTIVFFIVRLIAIGLGLIFS